MDYIIRIIVTESQILRTVLATLAPLNSEWNSVGE